MQGQYNPAYTTSTVLIILPEMPGSEFYRFERDFWEKSPDLYDRGFRAVTAQMADPLLEAVRLGNGTGRTLLDIASGPGYVAGRALGRGADVTALDFSAAMTERIRKNHPRIKTETADAQSLPFGDNRFDAAVCNFGIMHMEEPDRAFREALRVCKPGGAYAFSVWQKPELSPALGMLFEAITQHGTFDIPLPQALPFFHYSDGKTATAALQQAGFINPKTEDISLTWPVASAEALIATFRDGGARIGGILRAQTPAALQGIHDHVAQRLVPYRTGPGFAVPVVMVMTRGDKPGEGWRSRRISSHLDPSAPRR